MASSKMLPYRIDGAEWDGHGSILLAGRRFGVGLMCRPNADGTHTLWDGPCRPADTGCTTGWTVSVPMENGAVVSLTVDVEQVGVSISLGAGCWSKDATLPAPWQLEDLHSPVDLIVDGKTVVPWIAHSKKNRRDVLLLESHFWSNCDPDWAVEHMLRISRMSVVGLDRTLTEPALWLGSLAAVDALRCPACGRLSADPTVCMTCCSTGG
jgi:hypothetical protein